MKKPLLSAIAVLTFAAAGTVLAAESSEKETLSGADDTTVMTQAHNVKAEQKQHKQKQADEDKRGRPVQQKAPASN